MNVSLKKSPKSYSQWLGVGVFFFFWLEVEEEGRKRKRRETGLRSAHPVWHKYLSLRRGWMPGGDWTPETGLVSLCLGQLPCQETPAPLLLVLWALCATHVAKQGCMEHSHGAFVTLQLKETSHRRFVRPWERSCISEVVVHQFGTQETFRLNPAEFLCPGSLQCSVQRVHVTWKKYRWNFICRNRDTAFT